MFFFWSRPTAAATDRFDHRSTWRGGGRKGFLLHLSMCFFLLRGVFRFFFARRSFPVDHSILPMFFFEKTRGVFTSLSSTLVPLFLFFFLHQRVQIFFFLVLPSFVFEVGGKREKKVTTALPSSTQTKILEPNNNRNRYYPKLYEAPTKPNLSQTIVNLKRKNCC